MELQEQVSQRYLTSIRLFFSLILFASAAFFIYRSIHWQVMWDTSIMHYVVFLMDHGMAPYREIFDINLPGSYLIESWMMKIFGGGDIGWRLYEYTILGSLTLALIVISLPYDWFAGLYAGIAFAVLHSETGPTNAAERDEVMIALIMIGYALLFTALRKKKPLLMLPFGMLMGFGASIKPTAGPLAVVLLLMLAYAFRKRSIEYKSYVGYGVLGIVAGLLPTLFFFHHYQDFSAFTHISGVLTPYYAHIGNKSYSTLFQMLFAKRYVIPLAIGLVLSYVNRSRLEWENWERATLILGILFGTASWFVQHKGLSYHANPFQVFVLIWSAIEFAKAMRIKGWIHVLGLAGFVLGIFLVVLPSDRRLLNVASLSEPPDALKADLIRLGGSTLQKQVQCLDMVDGCFSTLYRLGLMPNTGFIADYMFLGPIGSPPLTQFRTIFWDDLHQHPPKIIVLTNQWFAEPRSFAKLDQWPELAAYVQSAYRLDVERHFPESAYRIYILKDDPAASR